MNPTRSNRSPTLSRERLLSFFLQGATPRSDWQVGMELEKMGRVAGDGAPIPYDGAGPSVRGVLEFLEERRGGEPVLEGDHLIGLKAPWGAMSIEPGGQIEWSSHPQPTLGELETALREHLAAMREAGTALGIEWLDVGVDPSRALADMPWMPKARYAIMRDYFSERGRLAHRMMTQTASIQCAFDFEDAEDWKRKFKAAAALAPVATAIFANSSVVDGADSGYRSFRQAIWRETDPDRCGLPPVVFDEGFDIEHWLDYILNVPTFFVRRARGLVPSGGESFGRLMAGAQRKELKFDDWATHVSTIFTEVRASSYIEVRSADLQPDDRAFAVPTFWCGTLYDDDALDAAHELGAGLDHAGWERAMLSAAREGLAGSIGNVKLRDAAERALAAAMRALAGGAPCTGDPVAARRPLEWLAEGLKLDPR